MEKKSVHEICLDLLLILSGKTKPVTKKQLMQAFPDLVGDSGRKQMERALKHLSNLAFLAEESYTESGNINYNNLLINSNKQFDQSLLTSTEQQELFTALALVQGAGIAELGTLLAKISGIIATKYDSWISIDFSDWYAQNQTKQLFTKLKEAILKQHVVKFGYRSWTKDALREVEPLKLIFKLDAWYLEAYCLKSEGVRRFRLTRIQSLSISKTSFERRVVKEEEKIPVIKDELTKFKFKISPDAGVRVLDVFGDAAIREGDFYLVEWQRRYNYDIEQNFVHEIILSFGEHIEVLEPATLRTKIKEIHLKALEKY